MTLSSEAWYFRADGGRRVAWKMWRKKFSRSLLTRVSVWLNGNFSSHMTTIGEDFRVFVWFSNFSIAVAVGKSYNRSTTRWWWDAFIMEWDELAAMADLRPLKREIWWAMRDIASRVHDSIHVIMPWDGFSEECDGSTSRWEPISDILEILDGSSDSFDLIVCWRKNYDIFGLHCLHRRRVDFFSLLHPLIIATEKKSRQNYAIAIFCRVNFLFFFIIDRTIDIDPVPKSNLYRHFRGRIIFFPKRVWEILISHFYSTFLFRQPDGVLSVCLLNEASLKTWEIVD